jgi:hypothetical protein
MTISWPIIEFGEKSERPAGGTAEQLCSLSRFILTREYHEITIRPWYAACAYRTTSWKIAFIFKSWRWSHIMNIETGLIFRAKEHRGCGIRAASYRVGPQTWIPEACVSLQTDDGATRLWVRSFVHCFMSENVTFSNKIEADNWAFNAAEAIIDKALPEFEPPSSQREPLRASYVSRFFAVARRRFPSFRRIQKFRRAE